MTSGYYVEQMKGRQLLLQLTQFRAQSNGTLHMYALTSFWI